MNYKKLLFIFSLLAFVSCNNSNVVATTNGDGANPAANATVNLSTILACNVAGIPPREWTCEEKKYIQHLGGCNLFCKADLAHDYQTCQSDRSPETVACHYEKVGRHLSTIF